MQNFFKLDKIYLIKRTKERNAKSIENNELEFTRTYPSETNKRRK